LQNGRRSVSLASEYASALGVATYCFAVCEWNAVYCCESIKPGEMKKIIRNAETAGAIAKRFANLVKSMPTSAERDALETVANRFGDLVKVRNSILHGKPCTAPCGDQRLFGPGFWEIADLEREADNFAQCGDLLNTWLHGFLKAFVPAP